MTTTATEKYIHISPYFIIYLNAFISIFGLFGNLLNIIVFINLRSFRRNPCVFYLMIDAIVNIGFSITANSNSLIWCKIKTMLINSFSLISMLITCFAALDQFFATSPHYYLRRRSTLKLSYRLTILSIFCAILFGIPIILYCDIYSTVGCIIRNSRFFFYYSYIHVPVLYGIFHSCISSLFGFLAFRETDKSRTCCRRNASSTCYCCNTSTTSACRGASSTGACRDASSTGSTSACRGASSTGACRDASSTGSTSACRRSCCRDASSTSTTGACRDASSTGSTSACRRSCCRDASSIDSTSGCCI
ncbi:unnamed protein product [Adineta steineri]|uniref:G-protein coupled receptors family 1 profile domain-containing protein n=1 Tax=Adineta steineri TaxID=433720 RepID=A0A815KCC5_9BILA|nr:unnamed protein product [Adineta steineri]CAF1610520.1 unnamed protein product [Adineta steineri]